MHLAFQFIPKVFKVADDSTFSTLALANHVFTSLTLYKGALARTEYLFLCFQLVATVWGRPTYKSDGQTLIIWYRQAMGLAFHPDLWVYPTDCLIAKLSANDQEGLQDPVFRCEELFSRPALASSHHYQHRS